MLSPGLTLDILLGVLCDHGYDVTKPHCTGFVTYAQESELEAELLRRIIGLMNGLSTETSFLDNLSITTAKLYTTDVTAYTPLPTGNIDGQDYQLIDKVLRDNQGLLLHQAMNSKVALPPDFVPDAYLADEFNTGTGNIVRFLRYYITHFLVMYTPATIPTLPTSILTARYRLHDAIRARCNSFQWLVDGHYDLGEEEMSRPHDLHNPNCRVVRYTPDGRLAIAVTSVRKALSYDASIYSGSYKSWISAIAQFYPLNPVRSFRMVNILLTDYCNICLLYTSDAADE